MYKQGLIITLQESVVLSQRNTTEGAHRGLDYITGSSLFGAVASSLYSDESIDPFKLFHSGAVRFRNAYPINHKQEITYPMPLCWYAKKSDSPIEKNKLDANKVWRIDALENQSLPDNAQPKQVRNGFISLSGNLAEVKQNFQLKTAINEQTQRAKEEALFGYESIQKGQQFYCEIEASDQNDLDAVSEVLSQGILIGRSRSAEFGKAQVSLIDPISTEHTAEDITKDIAEDTAKTNTDITLWCLSDAMIYNQMGQITFTPSANDIGLPDNYTLDIKRSHIRSRSYSPWNRHKQAYELEKQVIQKGSVLVYTTGNSIDNDISEKETAQIIEKLKQGIGADRTVGLGHIWVNPPLLTTVQPVFTEAPQEIPKAKEKPRSNTQSTESPLITWLDNSAGKSNAAELQAAREDIKEYLDILSNARQIEGKTQSEKIGPSRSQWGALLQKTKTYKSNCSADELLDFVEKENVMQHSMDGWKDRYCKPDDSTDNIKNFVSQCVRNREEKKLKPQRYLQFLAREAMSITEQGGAK